MVCCFLLIGSWVREGFIAVVCRRLSWARRRPNSARRSALGRLLGRVMTPRHRCTAGLTLASATIGPGRATRAQVLRSPRPTALAEGGPTRWLTRPGGGRSDAAHPWRRGFPSGDVGAGTGGTGHVVSCTNHQHRFLLSVGRIATVSASIGIEPPPSGLVVERYRTPSRLSPELPGLDARLRA